VRGSLGGELLEGETDVSEDLGFDWVGEGGMVLNLVNGPETEVGGSHCLLDLGG
jgi:hypothetical protein